MHSKATWNEDLYFTAELNGHKIDIDASAEHGGKDRGPRPKGLLLTSLIGCTGMDVASLFKKMKIPVESFTLEASADETNEHPKVYKDILLKYYFTGNIEDRINDLIKAIRLSQTKYCGVTTMLKKHTNINIKLYVNDKEIEYPQE